MILIVSPFVRTFVLNFAISEIYVQDFLIKSVDNSSVVLYISDFCANGLIITF